MGLAVLVDVSSAQLGKGWLVSFCPPLCIMLERYFVSPHTADRIPNAWSLKRSERSVEYLADQGYTARTVRCRVPLPVPFGEFARAQRGKTLAEPAYVEDLTDWISRHGPGARGGYPRPGFTKEMRGPVEQSCAWSSPASSATSRTDRPGPVADAALRTSCRKSPAPHFAPSPRRKNAVRVLPPI